jgi:hypothetical protein
MAKPFVIFDRLLLGYCTLVSDDGSTLLPLEWGSRAGAECWLFQCRIAWLAGQAPEPQGAGATIIEEVQQEGARQRTVRRWQ